MPARERLVALALGLLLAGCNESPGVPVDGSDRPDASSTIPCETDADCPRDLPMCHPFAKVCIGCIPYQDTCAIVPGDSPKVCDPDLHMCVPRPPDYRCHNSAECSGITTVCEPDAGVCVQCLTLDDCFDTHDFDSGVLTPVCYTNEIAGATGRNPDSGTNLCVDGCVLCVGIRPVCAPNLVNPDGTKGACCPNGPGTCYPGVPPLDGG
jgi:hypothetical protein